MELVDDAADAAIYVRWMPDVAYGMRKAGRTSHLPACCRLLRNLLGRAPERGAPVLSARVRLSFVPVCSQIRDLASAP